MDVTSIDWSVIPGLIQKSDQDLGVKNPTDHYVIVDPNWAFATGTSLRVYCSNAYGGGYLLSRHPRQHPQHLPGRELAPSRLRELRGLEEFGGHRRREQVALALVTAELAQLAVLLEVLDALADRGHAEGARHCDHRCDDGPVLAGLAELADEHPVDLEDVDRGLPQVHQ